MPHTVYVSAVIHAPVEEVWPLLRDFNALSAWHPVIAKSTIEGDGRPDTVGSVRHLSLNPSGYVRERLLMLDDAEHALRYAIIETDLAMRNYVAGVSLRPVTLGNLTHAEWWADFDVAPAANKQEVIDAVGKGVFAAGLKSLNEKLSR